MGRGGGCTDVRRPCSLIVNPDVDRGLVCKTTKTVQQRLQTASSTWEQMHHPTPAAKWKPSVYFPEWRGCFGCAHLNRSATKRHCGSKCAGSLCCSGHGTCDAGVCRCAPGFVGLDCAEPTIPVSPSSTPPPPAHGGGVRIYVYPVPPELGGKTFAVEAWQDKVRPIYAAEWRFADSLLRDGDVRTLDGERADLYYVPLLATTGPGGCERGLTSLLVRHVRTAHPWYNRSGGLDHVFFVVADKGGCGLGATGTPHILLTHLGWLGSNELWRVKDPHQREAMEPSLLGNATALRRAAAAGSGCFAPHKDVVVPPTATHELTQKEREKARAAAAEPRRSWEHALVHAGGVWGWKNFGPQRPSSYSLGMRQALFLTYGEQQGPDGLYVSNRSVKGGPPGSGGGPPPPRASWERSKFCLSTAGHGWGVRTARAVALSCLPLVAQPHIVQPFEGLLDYASFSRRVGSLREVANASDILRAVDAAKVATMRTTLGALAPAFSWERRHGGLAYEYTVLALCHRAEELRGRLRTPGATCAHHARAAQLGGVDGGTRGLRTPPWFTPQLAAATAEGIARRRAALKRRLRRRRRRRR